MHLCIHTDLPNKTKDHTQRKVQNQVLNQRKAKERINLTKVHLGAQSCKIVFSKSKPEPSGPGDIALKRQKKVSQEQKRKSATEKCNRGAISTVSIQTKPFHLFLLLFSFFFPF